MFICDKYESVIYILKTGRWHKIIVIVLKSMYNIRICIVYIGKSIDEALVLVSCMNQIISVI